MTSLDIIPIKVSRYFPARLGVRFCKVHRIPCTMAVLIHWITGQKEIEKELFCVECRRIIHWDDSYLEYVDVENERRHE